MQGLAPLHNAARQTQLEVAQSLPATVNNSITQSTTVSFNCSILYLTSKREKAGQFRNDLLPIVLPPPSLRLTALPPTVFCAVCRRYFGFCSGTPLYFAGIVPYFTASEARNLSSTARLLDCSDSSCSLFSPRLCQFVHDISTVHGSGRCYGIDVTVSFLRSLRSAVF